MITSLSLTHTHTHTYIGKDRYTLIHTDTHTHTHTPKIILAHTDCNASETLTRKVICEKKNSSVFLYFIQGETEVTTFSDITWYILMAKIDSLYDTRMSHLQE